MAWEPIGNWMYDKKIKHNKRRKPSHIHGQSGTYLESKIFELSKRNKDDEKSLSLDVVFKA